MSEIYIPAKSLEEDFVNLVKLELNDIRNTFFKIGFRLREANNCGYYIKLGYSSIEECAEALFGFKKTTTYDLMAVAYRFRDPKAPMSIAEEYKKFNQSQLVLFTSIHYATPDFIKKVSPDDSIQKLKIAKRYWNGYYSGKIRISNFYRLKSVDEIIEAGDRFVASLSEPKKYTLSDGDVDLNSVRTEKGDSSENSGYPENSENKSEDVIEISKDCYEDKSEDNSESSDSNASKGTKELTEQIVSYCGERLTHIGYRTIFDPDKKGLGLKVGTDEVSDFLVKSVYSFFKENRTLVKNTLQDYLNDRVGQFDYEINLCGRRQGINPFCGNLANYILDFFQAELDRLTPPVENKKKGKK